MTLTVNTQTHTHSCKSHNRCQGPPVGAETSALVCPRIFKVGLYGASVNAARVAASRQRQQTGIERHSAASPTRVRQKNRRNAAIFHFDSPPPAKPE
ncbi:hypothetical protein PAMP_013886 [Pampus punctatissimus]